MSATGVAMIRCPSCGRTNRGPREVCLYCGTVMAAAMVHPRVAGPMRASSPPYAPPTPAPSPSSRRGEPLPPRVASPPPEARIPLRPKRATKAPPAPPPPPQEEPSSTAPEPEADPEIESFLAELDKISSEFETRIPRRRTGPTPDQSESDIPPGG